jgi:subtilisin family serine protease
MAKITGHEEFVYVWTLGIDGLGDGSDKVVTVDVRPDSRTYGEVVDVDSVGGRHEEIGGVAHASSPWPDCTGQDRKFRNDSLLGLVKWRAKSSSMDFVRPRKESLMNDECKHDSTAGAVNGSSKRARRGALLAAAVALALYGQSVSAAQPPKDDPAAQGTTIRFVKSRILVQPKAGLTVAELDKILKPHGGRRTHYLPQINVHVIELPAQASEMAVANIMRGNPHIEFAELDQALEPNLTVNDPYYTSSWHLPKIGAPQAWDIKNGSGVVIAILDTGVDSTHPDLAPQMVPGWNSYDNNNDTADVHGHGTMVSGMAVAAGNNLAGSAGVAFGAKLMPIRIASA